MNQSGDFRRFAPITILITGCAATGMAAADPLALPDPAGGRPAGWVCLALPNAFGIGPAHATVTAKPTPES